MNKALEMIKRIANQGTAKRPYGKDADDNTIIYGCYEKGQEDIILQRLLSWDNMSWDDKEELGMDIASWLLGARGIEKIYLRYEPDYTHTSPLGCLSSSTMVLNQDRLFNVPSPFQLIDTIAHEINHYEQSLQNMIAKKTHSNPTYYDNEYLAIEVLLPNDTGMAFYNEDISEHESALQSYSVIEELQERMLKINLDGRFDKLIADSEDQLASLQDGLTTKIYSKIDYFSKHGAKDDAINEVLVWSNHFVNKLVNASKIDGGVNDMLGNIDTGSLGLSDLRTYINLATNKLDYDLHKQVVDVLIDNNRLESATAINLLDYQHSYDELIKVANILHSRTDDAMLLPIMFRYLTHLEADEIIDACSNVIGENETQACYDAFTSSIKKSILTHPHLLVFRHTIDVSASEEDMYSMILNNLYPGNYKEFVDEFGPTYLPKVAKSMLKEFKVTSNPEAIDTCCSKLVSDSTKVDNVEDMINFEATLDILSIDKDVISQHLSALDKTTNTASAEM